MSRIGDYEIVVEDADTGLALLRNPDGRGTVVRVDREKCQVYDAMPGDAPREGGAWFGRMTTGGVDYVSSWYSLGYARRMFRRLHARALAEAI